MAEDIKTWMNSDTVKELLSLSQEKLLRYYFFRDEIRPTVTDRSYFMSPADGIIIYQKVIKSKNDNIIEIKGKDYTLEDSLNKEVDIEYPCIVIGIFMTALDVHINRMPTSGFLSHYNIGAIASHNKPMLYEENELLSKQFGTRNLDYLHTNERVLNKVYIPYLNYTYYFLQIADYDVRMIIPFETKQNRSLVQSERMGIVRWGSQCDLILPYSKELEFTIMQDEHMHVKGGLDPLIKVVQKKRNITKLKSKYSIEPLKLKNDKGETIVIPEKYRVEVQDMIESGCHSCIDALLKQLNIK